MTTSILNSLVSFLSNLHRLDHDHKHNILLVRSLEALEIILFDNYKCVQYLVNEVKTLPGLPCSYFW